MSEALFELSTVAETLKEQALHEYRQSLKAQEALDQELRQIDTMRQAAQADADGLNARRMTGADAAWQAWMARRRGEIQSELAMARVRVEESRRRAGDALSRSDAVRLLQQERAEQLGHAATRRQARTLDALIVLQRSRRLGQGR